MLASPPQGDAGAIAIAPPFSLALLPRNVPRRTCSEPISSQIAPPLIAVLLMNSVFSTVASPASQRAPPLVAPRPLFTKDVPPLISLVPSQYTGPLPLKWVPSIVARLQGPGRNWGCCNGGPSLENSLPLMTAIQVVITVPVLPINLLSEMVTERARIGVSLELIWTLSR